MKVSDYGLATRDRGKTFKRSTFLLRVYSLVPGR